MSYKNSPNPKVEELTKSHKGRSYRLSDLKPEGQLCIWCMEPRKGKRQKWCSAECIHFALAWSAPQRANGLYILLARQDWKCAECNHNYKSLIDQINSGNFRKKSRNYKKDRYFWLMKHLKMLSPKGTAPEVDHIIAIALGGTSLGLDNVRCICESCHKIKTKHDNKTRHAIYGSKRKGVKFTKDHCEALSRVRKGISTPARKAARQKSKVLQYKPITAINISTGETIDFESIAKCANVLGLNAPCISRVINGSQNRTQHKGWTFKTKIGK